MLNYRNRPAAGTISFRVDSGRRIVVSRRDWLRNTFAGVIAGRTMSADGLFQGSPITRPIPRTNERLPVIGLGTWQTFDVNGSAGTDSLAEVLRQFVRAGGKLVDSSPMYGRAETVLGDLSQRLGLQSSLFFATKVWTSGKQAGVQQMNASFDRIKVKRMDLMQVHNLLDVEAHLETISAWKKQGRIRYAGITHYQAGAYDDLERLISDPGGGIDFVQFNYSLATRDAERRLLKIAADHNVGVLINRPYEGGGMFDRVRGKPLPGWAHEIDCESWGQVFLKYIVSHPAVTCAIPATSNPKHLADNMGASRGRLPDEALRKRIALDWDRL
jgi:diketogulonate reductase-like aldo/keto reductase